MLGAFNKSHNGIGFRSALNISAPYVYLPLVHDDGTTSLVDTGIGATWTASGTSMFGTAAGFVGSQVNDNHIYCNDADVISLFDMLNGAVNSVGGGILFVSMIVTGWSGAGGIMQFGSRNSASGGWEINQGSGNGLGILTNPDGAGVWSGVWKLTGASVLPTSGEYHLAFMLDYKTGYSRVWIDSEILTTPAADRSSAIAAGNPGGAGDDGGLGILLFARDTTTTTAGARSVNNESVGSFRDFFAIDLTNNSSPWRYPARVAKALSNMRGTLPPVLEVW